MTPGEIGTRRENAASGRKNEEYLYLLRLWPKAPARVPAGGRAAGADG